MSAAVTIPDVIFEKALKAVLERRETQGTFGIRPDLRAALTAVWADIRLPDPAGGCACSFDSEDRGGGYSELVQEYEPACPEHSEHLYDPVLGVWVLRDQVSATRPERPVPSVEAVQPGEGGFF